MKKFSLALSIVLIVIYVALTNAGSVLSTQFGLPYMGRILLLLAFSVFLFIYMAKKGQVDAVGLMMRCRPTGHVKRLVFSLYRRIPAFYSPMLGAA